MTIATGTTNMDAQTVLCTLKGSIGEVRNELATGSTITAAYAFEGKQQDIIGFAGSGTTWAVIYKRHI